MFKAAFDARYPYHPPFLLSEILPTRAESLAYVDAPLASSGEKWRSTKAGPIALIAVAYGKRAADCNLLIRPITTNLVPV